MKDDMKVEIVVDTMFSTPMSELLKLSMSTLSEREKRRCQRLSESLVEELESSGLDPYLGLMALIYTAMGVFSMETGILDTDELSSTSDSDAAKKITSYYRDKFRDILSKLAIAIADDLTEKAKNKNG